MRTPYIAADPQGSCAQAGRKENVFYRTEARCPSTALLVSLMQISLKPDGKLIAFALTTKKQFLPTAL